MHILFWAAMALIAVVAIVSIYAFLQKSEFSIIREADFKAAPNIVFAKLNDFRNWSAWSPWEKMDLNLTRAYSGAHEGVGAKYAWIGNKKVGEGNMEITHATPNSKIQLDLNFIKPFTASNITEFTLTPNKGGTTMQWEMRGTRPFIMRLFGLIFSMDKLVGGDFEKGMANLKQVLGE